MQVIIIAIGLRDDGNEDETLEFPFQAFVYTVRFEEAIVRIFIEVDGERFFNGCGNSSSNAWTNSVTQPLLLSLWR